MKVHFWFRLSKQNGWTLLIFYLLQTCKKQTFLFISVQHATKVSSFSKLISFDENILAFNLYGICKLFLLNQDKCLFVWTKTKCLLNAKDFLTHSLYIVWTGFTIQNSMVKFSKKKKKKRLRENYTCCKGALHQFYYELWKDTSFYYKLWNDTLKTNCEWKETLNRLKTNQFCFRLWFYWLHKSEHMVNLKRKIHHIKLLFIRYSISQKMGRDVVLLKYMSTRCWSYVTNWS